MPTVTMWPWPKRLTKYDDTQDDADYHNEVQQQFVTGITFILGPKRIVVFLILHPAAKIPNKSKLPGYNYNLVYYLL